MSAILLSFSFISFCYAVVNLELRAWWIACGLALAGVVCFFAGL